MDRQGRLLAAAWVLTVSPAHGKPHHAHHVPAPQLSEAEIADERRYLHGVIVQALGDDPRDQSEALALEPRK